MTRLGNGQDALRKVYIAPLQGNEFPNTQTTVKAKNDAVQFIFLAHKNGLLYLLLFDKCKALHGLFFELRAFEFICHVFFCKSQQVRRFERTLNDGDNGIDAVR